MNTKIKNTKIDLVKGSISKGMLKFAAPLLIGQLLQQMYSMADAIVVGNFATNESFAAVSSAGSLNFLIVGFFSGIAVGGSVIISKYFGANDRKNVEKAIHNEFLLGIIVSVLCTLVGLILAPKILGWMNVPENVFPKSLEYFSISFAGISTVIMYNMCMAIMRALGDSVNPTIYLFISTCTNIVLDLLFVGVFKWDVAGAAVATVISQGISAILCIIKMLKDKDYTGLDLKKLKYDKKIMNEIVLQGLPSGVQNSVISIGNIVVQSNINLFGEFAMSGYGAYAKVEGFVFLPITCMSMTLPTFVSQNLGAGEHERAKKGSVFGIVVGMIFAELIGVVLFLFAPYFLKVFIPDAEAIAYGVTQSRVVSFFFCLLAFSHCAAGVMRGCGKAYIPMITMLSFWCVIRVIYVVNMIKIRPDFSTISWAYPLTWTLSSIVFAICLLKTDWEKAFG